MPENNNIKNYSSTDIERYHKGQMSPEEMHALEKAALDDPFLADAIEGYKLEGVNPVADISFLRNKLNQRVAGTNVVELKTFRMPGWLKAAASIVIIIGAGIMIYQFSINKGNDKVVKVQEPNKEKVIYSQPAADSPNTNITTNSHDVVKTDKIVKDEKIIDKEEIRTEKTVATDVKPDTANSVSTALAAPVLSEIKQDTIEIKPNRDQASFGNSNTSVLQKSKKADDEANVSQDVVISASRSKQAGIQHTNVFRGQVLDANYNALPFANITSTRDKVGTYADAKGQFILTSATDSVLNVQIKYVGYENSIALLRNNLPKNQVILQEDTKNLNEIVIYNKKSNSLRRKQVKKVVEEPEPEDGWENYDTYIVNNLNFPDEIQTNSPGTREVEISFNVNKNGEPINFKVEKSLCKECDIEAIRLLKEGPKWKRKGKQSRGSVTVPF